MIFYVVTAMILLGVEPGQRYAGANTADTRDKSICKTRPQTGSRFPTKICRSAAQWEKLAEQNRRDMAETVERPFIVDCRNTGGGC